MSFDIPPDLAAGLRAWIADIVRTELKVQLAGIVPSPKVPPSPFMTAKEAGEYARVSAATIRKWIRAERLQAHGAGRELRVRIDDLVDALRPQRHRSAIRGSRERELSPEELANEMIERWDGEREMLRRSNMTGDEALRLAGPLTASGFGGREGARTRDRNKEQRLVREGKLTQVEFDKRQAERDRLSRLDRARRRGN
jgi:excisionase family DNA binding protein